MSNKTLDITEAKGARANIADLKTWGDADTWKLISKASSEAEGWMKSTKAMNIPGVGCVVQVTTQQGNNIAEALTFVPFVTIINELDEAGNIIGRRLEMAGAQMLENMYVE